MEPPGAGPTLSFWGPDPVPLPPRFARIKRNLIAGHEADVEASWARLVDALRAEVEHIEGLGPHLIPSVEFADLDDPAQTARFGRDLRRYGVGVVRKALPRPFADDAVRDTVRYLDHRRECGSRRASPAPAGSADPTRAGPGAGSGPGLGPDDAGAGAGPAATAAAAAARRPARLRAPRQDPTCYDCFWTPAQVRCRAHPNVLRAQRFMMSLWDTGAAADRLATRLPIAYADRIRVEGGGFDASSAASPGGGGGFCNGSGSSSACIQVAAAAACSPSSTPEAGPSSLQQQHLLARQSADDWITALQSSAGIIAQVDNGSLERWEPDGYGRGGTYDRIFHGHWEHYDPWQCASRVGASIDLYNGYGSCSILRMFQGLLALSTTEPGMLRLLPSPRLATAYYLLRPFFSPRRPAPGHRSGPDWDAYLAPDNWELQRDPDTIIHGAVPGHAQRVTERWHPHLHLRSSLVTLPTLQPGDYILWHPDLPYHFSSNPRPGGGGGDDDAVSMLVYVPAAPLTQTNALYLARQRKAFRRGLPGPDFDSCGRGILAEDPDLRPGESDMDAVGGAPALRAMGLARWEEDPGRAVSATGPDAEADIVRLANLILFPE
ncbi:hypothetical protein HRG_010221 [Hirsutella rhossiliensis]|uniref:DUF1479 domain-containing protein n=1 Tax=Hirsutella rhossiliensis TaxID=111463 RepID=A0A9P8SE28_9HYPO|nr:uncharacterized protein HRG_10221 [Hirsutella rhossiliensis]KAH0958534.1 hypothetical protein HRG_10221 [Hirsutella rhossiliensis]